MINWGRLRYEERLIREAGYSIRKEKPWHWEVTQSDSNVLIHVWPTTGKYMAHGDSGSSPYSDNLIECLARAFTPVTMDADPYMDEVQGWQKRFSDEIKSMLFSPEE